MGNHVSANERFRLTNVIPERIICISWGITVVSFRLDSVPLTDGSVVDYVMIRGSNVANINKGPRLSGCELGEGGAVCLRH
jgi:hypothetical protein